MKQSRALREILVNLSVLAGSIGLFLALTEAAFRMLESSQAAKTYHKGPGGLAVADPRWGWKPSEGSFEQGTIEFDVRGHINHLSMNDLPPGDDDWQKTRLLCLGDSHTYAVGVSADETWPKRLESLLGAGSFRAYNAAASGYSLHQYLLRLIDQGPLLRPMYVVVGFSWATDLYDLLPPERGGWIYGGDSERDYFDLDAEGRLLSLHWSGAARHSPRRRSAAVLMREFLGHLALFRYVRRSPMALAVGRRVTVGGQSMWPNMDVVLERDVSPKHQYQWRLATAILSEMRTRSAAMGARLIVVGIPYLPQVYDEVWNVTFAGSKHYDRNAAANRMRTFCEAQGIAYVDTLEDFRSAHATSGAWLHYRHDAHPTRAGQELIARTLAASGLFVAGQNGLVEVGQRQEGDLQGPAF